MKKKIMSESIAFALVFMLASSAMAQALNDSWTVQESNWEISSGRLSAQDAADMLNTLGLFRGEGMNPDGTPDFALERTATRNEAITMLVRLLGKESEAMSSNLATPFTDLHDWVRPYVGYAYANGLTTGTSATTFGGGQAVTSSQYITFVLRSLGYASGVDFEWDAPWELSDAIGLTHGQYNTAVAAAFLRSEIAEISYCALNATIKGSDAKLCSQLIDAGVFSETTARLAGLDMSAAPPEAAQTPAQAPAARDALPNPVPEPAAEADTAPALASATSDAMSISEFELKVFELTNLERTNQGLSALIWDDTLARAARLHSEDMAVNNIFSHTGSDGSSFSERATREGMQSLRAGAENIIAGYSTPESVVQGWMDSPGHRANILSSNYTHIGVGIHYLAGSQFRYYGTQLFWRS